MSRRAIKLALICIYKHTQTHTRVTDSLKFPQFSQIKFLTYKWPEGAW